MKKSHGTILGISLGVRRMGIAIGTHEELMEYQVKGFDERFSQAKVDRICKTVERIIIHYGITGIGVKAPQSFSSHNSLNSALEELSKLAKSNNIPIKIFDVELLEKKYMPTGKWRKKKLAAVLLRHYPELRRFYSKIESGKGLYYLKLFEAVAAMQLFLESDTIAPSIQKQIL
jgi:RNase H-fold protein (predicted Holliday junction resolvase)